MGDGFGGAFFAAADEHERANGNSYREFELALPVELSDAERGPEQYFKRANSKQRGGKPQISHRGPERRVCVAMDDYAGIYGKGGDYRIAKGY